MLFWGILYGEHNTFLVFQYRQYQITTEGKNGRIKFRFCDTMGMEGGDAGLSPDDMAKIMDGHVRNQADVSFM